MWIMFNDDKLINVDSFEIRHFMNDGSKCSIMACHSINKVDWIFNSDYLKCVQLMSDIASAINDGIKILYIREGRIKLGDSE